MAKLRYTIYDEARKRWLMSFQRPVEECDATVTRWTSKREHAMRFPGVKTARGVARLLEPNKAVVVLNARGQAVQEG